MLSFMCACVMQCTHPREETRVATMSTGASDSSDQLFRILEGIAAVQEPSAHWVTDIGILSRSIALSRSFTDLWLQSAMHYVHCPGAASTDVFVDTAGTGSRVPVTDASSRAIGIMRCDHLLLAARAYVMSIDRKDPVQSGVRHWIAVLLTNNGLDDGTRRRLVQLLRNPTESGWAVQPYRDIAIGAAGRTDWCLTVALLCGSDDVRIEGASGATDATQLADGVRTRFVPRRAGAYATLRTESAISAWESLHAMIPVDERIACLLRTRRVATKSIAWADPDADGVTSWIPIQAIPAHEAGVAFLRIAMSQDGGASLWGCGVTFLAACGIVYAPPSDAATPSGRMRLVPRQAPKSTESVESDARVLGDPRISAAILCTVLSLQRLRDAISEVPVTEGRPAGSANRGRLDAARDSAPLFDLLVLVFQRFACDTAAALAALWLRKTMAPLNNAAPPLSAPVYSFPWITNSLRAIHERGDATRAATVRWIAKQALILSRWAARVFVISQCHRSASVGRDSHTSLRAPAWWYRDLTLQEFIKSHPAATCPFKDSAGHTGGVAGMTDSLAASAPDVCQALVSAWGRAASALMILDTVGDSLGSALIDGGGIVGEAIEMARHALLCPMSWGATNDDDVRIEGHVERDRKPNYTTNFATNE